MSGGLCKPASDLTKKLCMCVNPILAGFADSWLLDRQTGENGFTQKI